MARATPHASSKVYVCPTESARGGGKGGGRAGELIARECLTH
eukprot:CAMPEP_0170142164 /NCGR_PEP_ID=MMETSP0033_2-20121228/7471_1 /TAXON_ID=195969 /ORGANISM="Dolichomastix tenuilepis, Strain CCMP3274" /LENGTH=41 /DNA_ID= /DNA_START= /DNA_END= /DNA_ORIENTATION=